MKKLEVLIARASNGVEFTDNVLRSKLILHDSEIRPEYIEINNNKGDCKVNMNFADNENWKGSMANLKKDLKLAELSKQLVKAVQNGGDFDSIVERIILTEGGLK